jgi:transposase-like protein
MAEKSTTEGFQFLVEELKSDKDAVYADLKAKADKKGLPVYPVMFGRAKLMLGLAKKKAQPGTAGTNGQPRGRKRNPNSKSARVRELLGGGMTAAEIAKTVGVSTGLVYSLKGRGASRKERPAPRQNADKADGLENIVASIREGQREREQLRRALEQIRTLIDQALG